MAEAHPGHAVAEGAADSNLNPEFEARVMAEVAHRLHGLAGQVVVAAYAHLPRNASGEVDRLNLALAMACRDVVLEAERSARATALRLGIEAAGLAKPSYADMAARHHVSAAEREALRAAVVAGRDWLRATAESSEAMPGQGNAAPQS
ncbi:MAG: hypothetical protein E7K72_25175 [Roseomonas mucosa]|nr:hypothetical protein [Roseomonas mucosa]